MVMFQTASNLDHCAEEGTCLAHCTNLVGHMQAQNGLSSFLFDAKPPILMGTVEKITSALEQPDTDEGSEEADPPPDTTKALAYVQEAIMAGQPQKVHAGLNAILEAATNSEPTPAEKVALFVAGLEALARSEHGTLVALTEGRTLEKHKTDFGNDCGVCENLDRYFDAAFALLQPLAVDQKQQTQKAIEQKQRALQGVCVDCGEAPSNGRTYTLDKGQGYMCSACAGPFLLMDDGQPGDEWAEAE